MRRKTIIRIVLGAVFPLALLFVIFWALYVKIPIPCIFHRLTGLYCPSCGATRAVIYMMHGNIGNALKSNAFVTVAAVPALLTAAAIWFCVVFDKQFEHIFVDKLIFLLGITALAYVLFGIVRNIPVSPFIYLCPIN